MDKSIVIGLIQNTAILLTFSMLYENMWLKKESAKKLSNKLLAGVILGAIGIVLMFTPWKAAPGIVFDTRSILLSVSGLFFGGIPTICAVIITGTLRIIQGGDGLWMGLAVISSSGAIGVLWRRYRPQWRFKRYKTELILLGLTVHLVMMACTLLMPPEKIWSTFKTIALPLIFIYTPATLLLGMLMINQTNSWKNRLAREKLREMVSRFNKIFESGNILSVILDKRGNIIFCNNYLIEISQYAHHELIGKNWFDIFIPNEKREKLRRIFNQMVTMRGSTKHFEGEILTKNGKLLYISWFNLSLYSEKSENKGLASIGVNITDRKHFEDKLKEQNDEIEAQNEELIATNKELVMAKLKAEESDFLKTAFLQNMSHEIRTPMNAIIGFSSLLNKSNLTKEKTKEFTKIINNSAGQLLSIVNDVLTISSIDAKQEELNILTFNLNQLLDDLHTIFKSQAQDYKIALFVEKELSNKHAEIKADQTKLTQIISNLVGNALKFSKDGTVIFGYLLKDNETENDLPAGTKILEFFVKDTGIGIHSEMINKVFERFRQADLSISKKYGGTGLGLTISKAFVELMGGKIWVESREGEGSNFYFTIPYNPVIQSADSQQEVPNLNGKKTILVAEDDEFSFIFIKEIIGQLNLEYIHVENGQQAIDICQTNKDIGIVLMDIQMPIISGHEAAKQIKKFNPELPIIAQTAYALESDRLRFNDNSFDDYLTKPLNEEELKQKLAKYLIKG